MTTQLSMFQPAPHARRPILIGMNNPISSNPDHALYPVPEGCTGNRLWKMLHARTGASMGNYRDVFERRNLVKSKVTFDLRHARARAYEITTELRGTGRSIVLLGQEVREAFGHDKLLLHPQEIDGCTWRQVPHPSGRNLFYNSPENVRVVELLLEELYRNYLKQCERETTI